MKYQTYYCEEDGRWVAFCHEARHRSASGTTAEEAIKRLEGLIRSEQEARNARLETLREDCIENGQR